VADGVDDKHRLMEVVKNKALDPNVQLADFLGILKNHSSLSGAVTLHIQGLAPWLQVELTYPPSWKTMGYELN